MRRFQGLSVVNHLLLKLGIIRNTVHVKIPVVKIPKGQILERQNARTLSDIHKKQKKQKKM